MAINEWKKVRTAIWEHEAAGSNPVTRTILSRKPPYIGGFLLPSQLLRQLLFFVYMGILVFKDKFVAA